MTVPMAETIDQAQYVEVLDPDNELTRYAVWHGGHTVNVYETLPACKGNNVVPARTFNVGDFETGEVTIEDVKEGINDVCYIGTRTQPAHKKEAEGR